MSRKLGKLQYLAARCAYKPTVRPVRRAVLTVASAAYLYSTALDDCLGAGVMQDSLYFVFQRFPTTSCNRFVDYWNGYRYDDTQYRKGDDQLYKREALISVRHSAVPLHV